MRSDTPTRSVHTAARSPARRSTVPSASRGTPHSDSPAAGTHPSFRRLAMASCAFTHLWELRLAVSHVPVAIACPLASSAMTLTTLHHRVLSRIFVTLRAVSLRPLSLVPRSGVVVNRVVLGMSDAAQVLDVHAELVAAIVVDDEPGRNRPAEFFP